MKWKEALDVASDNPPEEALSCRRRAWDVPYCFYPTFQPDSLQCGMKTLIRVPDVGLNSLQIAAVPLDSEFNIP